MVLPADVRHAARTSPTSPRIFAAYPRARRSWPCCPRGAWTSTSTAACVRSVPLSSLPRLVRSPGGTEGSLRPVTEKVRRDVPFVVAGNRNVTIRACVR